MVDAVLQRGGSFFGIDLSTAMVAEAREMFEGREHVEFAVGDIEGLDVPDASYDQVICMGVLEYLTQADQALREIGRVLRPDGVAVITTPKRRHIDRVTLKATAPLRYLARLAGAPGSDRLPRLCLEPKELDAAAERAGFIRDGGSMYNFTPLPYPLTRVAPNTSMKVNLRFERWHRAQDRWRSFFAHGYVGRYHKP
jgi:SAM-dependent methyltransferase